MSLKLCSSFADCIKILLKSHSISSAMFSLKHTRVDFYEGPEVCLIEVKKWLSKFGGGEVILKQDNGIAEIILDHPNKKNAMSGLMMVQLADIVEKLENWKEGKSILLRGEGSIFCSGGDLDFAKASPGPENGFKMACFMHNVLSRLRALPMVSVAVIQGQGALGGGAEVATACDWRLMTSDCRGIGFVHSRMGIVPAWGGSSRLASIVGSRVALELISSGRIIPPNESLQIGLIDAIVEPTDDKNGLPEAVAWLSKRIQAEPQVIRAAKATLTKFDHFTGISRSLEEERRLFAPLWGATANRKALESKLKHLKS